MTFPLASTSKTTQPASELEWLASKLLSTSELETKNSRHGRSPAFFLGDYSCALLTQTSPRTDYRDRPRSRGGRLSGS